MAKMECPDQQQSQFPMLELPNYLLLNILQWLDVQSLCYASRTCTLLSRIAAHPSLWPSFTHENWAVWDVRCTLARILRLPPQVFQVQLDVKRSRKFPVTVPLHNLRPLLNITDTEGLADRLSKAVQDQVHRLSGVLWRFQTWQDYPPAASISVCRADRASVRASLRPEAVVPRLVQQLQQLGWPPASDETAALIDKQLAATHTDAPAANGAAAKDGAHTHHTPIPHGAVADGTNMQSAYYQSLSLPEPQENCPSHSAAAHGNQRQEHQPYSGVSWDPTSSRRRPRVETSAMWQCLQACGVRCDLLSTGALTQLSALKAARHSSWRGSSESRERLVQLRALAAHITAAAAHGRLPDETIIRETAVNQFLSLGIDQQAAHELAPAGVRLLYVSAAADRSMLTFSLPGKPGWLLMLEKAVKILARLHTLQQVCLCSQDSSLTAPQYSSEQHVRQHRHVREVHATPGIYDEDSLSGLPVQQPPRELTGFLSACAAAMETAWHSAGDRELQLCLAGLQEFAQALSGSTVGPPQLYRCAQLLEAAASEYAAEGAQNVGTDTVADAIRRMGLLKLQLEQEEQQVMRKVWQLAVTKVLVGDHAENKLERDGDNSAEAIKPGMDTGTATEVRNSPIAPTQQMIVRCCMHIEALRALSWCMWLLGALQ